MPNPLIQLGFEIPFDQIEAAHVEPAIDALDAYLEDGRPALVRPDRPDAGAVFLSRRGTAMTRQNFFTRLRGIAIAARGVAEFTRLIRTARFNLASISLEVSEFLSRINEMGPVARAAARSAIPGFRALEAVAGNVTDETLDGLFQVLATEEQKIREDPVARSTDLLRTVFGSR